jgi:hypothetical protein
MLSHVNASRPGHAAGEPYVRFRQRTGVDALSPADAVIARLTDAPLGDASRIDPVPLILPDADLEEIREGVRQRARALQRFLADIARGHGAFLAQREGLPNALLARILTDYGHDVDELRLCWASRDRADVCFTYAPDLVRVGDGAEWRVLEDNVGCIGGLADSWYCRCAYLAAVGVDSDADPDAVPDLCRGVQRFLAGTDAARAGVELGCDASVDGRVIRESARRAELLRRIGIRADDGSRDSCVARIVNFPSARAQYHGAFRRGEVTLLNSPYAEILGDKRLLPHVEAMISFYLGEEPRLRALGTRVVEVSDDVAAIVSGVLKLAQGAQGSSVYFLDDAQERERALRAVEQAEAMSFVLQEAAAHTRGNGGIHHDRLELRPFAFVVGDDAVVASRTPSARVPATGRRRANLGQGSRYAAVLAESSTQTGASACDPRP